MSESAPTVTTMATGITYMLHMGPLSVLSEYPPLVWHLWVLVKMVVAQCSTHWSVSYSVNIYRDAISMKNVTAKFKMKLRRVLNINVRLKTISQHLSFESYVKRWRTMYLMNKWSTYCKKNRNKNSITFERDVFSADWRYRDLTTVPLTKD